MAIQNKTTFTLAGFDASAQHWADLHGLHLTDPSVGIVDWTDAPLIPMTGGSTFLDFKYPSPGVVLTDDQAMAAAIAKLGPLGGTLIINSGIVISLTKTVTIPDSMQIISAETGTTSAARIVGTMVGPMFNMTSNGKVLLEGLNMIDNGPSGSIVVMSGDNTTLINCQFANSAGNTSSIVKFGGYDQVIQNCTFSNYDANAFSWEAVYTQWAGTNTDINDKVVGGAAFGVGKGGLIDTVGSHFVEGFSIDNFSCATAGTQIQARDVYSLYIRGGVYEGASGSAIVLGGGTQQVTGVDIEGAYISAGGTAIDAAPTSGSGINDLTIQDCQIGGAGTGVSASCYVGRLSLLGNDFSSNTAAVDLQNPAVATLAIGNTIHGNAGTVAISAGAQSVWVGNTLADPLSVSPLTALNSTFSFNGGSASYLTENGNSLQTPSVASSAVALAAVNAASMPLPSMTFDPTQINSGMVSFVTAIPGETFLDFRHPAQGVTLSDDEAFAAAIAKLGPLHGTLVINDGLTIKLTHSVAVPYSMAIVSQGGGMDVSSLITNTGTGDIFRVTASGPVLVQGLNLQSGASGSIIETGAGNTVVRDCQLTNVAGNSSTMVVIQGADQLVQDCFFSNNESSAYSWSASYADASTSSNVSSTIDGGWAYGIGKGGLVGGPESAYIASFNIYGLIDITTGATQVEAGNVGMLTVQGGVYDYSSESAFKLGVGITQVRNVSISSSYISTASNQSQGIAIDAGPTGGTGVANLLVQDNQINFAGTGIRADSETGNLTAVGNDFLYCGLGFNVAAPTGTVTVVGNQLDFSDALAVQQGGSNSTQTYLGNSFNGSATITANGNSGLSFIDNVGSATYVDAAGVPLQPNAITTNTASTQISKMSITVIEGLTSSQMNALTSSQLTALTSVQEAALSPSQVGVLTSAQLESLLPVQIGSLTIAQIGSIDPASLAALSSSQVARLLPAQIGGLSSSQLHELSTVELRSLTAMQLSAIAVPEISSLTQDQLAEFTAEQVNGLSAAQIANLTASQVAALSGPAATVVTATQSVAKVVLASPTQSQATPVGTLTDSSGSVGPLATAQVAYVATTTTPSTSSQNAPARESSLAVTGANDPLFDTAYYLANNPDVAAAGVDPYSHYLTYGWKEGRNPSALFDTNFYLKTNPSVAAAGANPLVQFESGGWKAGADPSSTFSVDLYLQANPDVAGAGIDPLLHYVDYGAKEGRAIYTSTEADPLIDEVYVYVHNPSVAEAGLNAANWYDSVGWKLGADPNAMFDTNYYLTHNPDVKTAGMDPLTHYENYGWKEGRDPGLAFNDIEYLSVYRDVAAANVDPLQHYLTYGATEGRLTFLAGTTAPANPLINAAFYDAQLGVTLVPDGIGAAEQAAASYAATGWKAGLNPDAYFDTNYYLSHNPDVAAAHINPLTHYENQGWIEGRDPSAAFSTNKYLAAYSDVKAAGIDPLNQFLTAGPNSIYHAFVV